MISSASTLLLATLVFNAATVFGAPIRNVDTSSESIARAEMTTPVQPVARAAIIDVQDNRRRSLLGRVTRRSARLVSERDEPLPEAVVLREPEPVVDVVAPIVESRERRYPRRALHERHEERKPAVTVIGTTMVPAVQPRERRYPRRALHDRHEKREPATSIKEVTTVVEKITVLDTPEDALAFNANNPGNSASASSTVTTLVSISATTTLASDSSAPTSTATNSVSASSTASSASVTASASASSTTDSASASATSTASSTSSATESTITASATSTASSGDPKASASSTSSADGADPTPTAGSSAITVDNTPRAAGGGDPNTEVRRGIYIRASTEPILRRVGFSGASWASSVRRQLNTH